LFATAAKTVQNFTFRRMKFHHRNFDWQRNRAK